ncbi:hypothetical protein OESDEN_05402 [Oesophagostomum dentatum]|uniref:Uncharacterized protein n=1 Tax=Oesophagostomum dentatum TaxID=61180 RepID=A0A0B1TF14_OESDE|nr:hypothetical protein OESDEN_05402 [Oesophagostomum dentatum]
MFGSKRSDVPETSEERIQDFVMVVRLLNDVANTYEEQKNDTKQTSEVVFPMFNLAKYVTKQIDDSVPQV